MKTTLHVLKTALVVALLSFWIQPAQAQSGLAVTMEVKNLTQTAPNQFTYDIFLYNTGTVPYLLRGYSCGLIHAAGLNNGGTITHTFLSRDAAFPTAFPVVTPGYTPATNHIRLTTLNAASGNEVSMAPGSSVRLATMRIATNAATFATNFAPALTMQLLTQSGRTSCVATCMVGTTSYAVNSAGNNPIAGSLQLLTGVMNAPCFYLNPSGNALSSQVTGSTNVNCYNGSDGTAQITLSGIGSAASGTYTINGGAPHAYAASPFTITGLSAGTSYFVITTSTGCVTTDSVTLTAPTVPLTATESATACDSYTWPVDNASYTASGVYTGSMIGTSGCPVYVTLTLTILNSTSNTYNVTACDTYTWALDNNTYTNSGTYTITSTNGAGCTHSEILNLVINSSTSSSVAITACDSYTWADNGATYTSSGIYTATYLNAGGCLHNATLDLTINQSTSISESATACDTYTWAYNNATYTSSGSYVSVGVNASNCPETHTLNLTINNSTSNVANVTACDSYTWIANNSTYTTGGSYTMTSNNAAGCLHTETLNLTINNSTSGSSAATSCDSYTWTCNGATYTSSGTYTCTYMNTAGCLHTETLNLTVNSSTSASSSATACDSYTWNGNTYNASGTYTQTSLNAAGCLHTETLNLTVNYSTSTSNSATACDSYVWNGNTYSTSGTYTQTSMNAGGCTHTDVLNLTINNSSSNVSTIVACDMYNWTVNGATYTSSGTYTYTSMNTSGCTHTEILYLTINYSSSSVDNIVACDSYVWPMNNATYTASGTYTSTGLNASGCPHAATLNLTINSSSSSSVSITACGSYTWAVDGGTYTASGAYTHTSLNTVGCTHTATLNLTIIHGSYLAVKAILSGAYNTTNGLMNDNLRTMGLIPITEPYTGLPYSKPAIGFPAGEATNTTVLGMTGPDAPVDWVYLELRSATNSSVIAYTVRALIQRDGDVVDPADGMSPVFLPGLLSGSYFVSIKHRNHLGIMTATPVSFNYCSTTSVDFTGGAVWVKPGQVFGPRRMYGAIGTMWSSDANNNKATRYNGLSNDKDAVLNAVGVGTPNNVINNVYRMEDVNMDGAIKYNNTDNDRIVIYGTVLAPGGSANNTITQHTPN
ncbi:MAG TPA: hypothetical protein PLP14_03210 [Chitinophagaceae bacterium]|nr:hypothetical protein [Chitinophagaceae bacterium]